MKRYKVISLFVFFLISVYSVVGQMYTFRHYGHKDGLILSSLLTAVEAPNGFIWLGTDGGGIVKFDGKNFKYLNQQQGRTNRHVSNICVDNKQLYFSTMYRGVFKYQNDSISKVDYVQQFGRNLFFSKKNNTSLVLQDSGLKIYKDSLLVEEKLSYPYNKKTNFYGKFSFLDNFFVFSSKGNYIVQDQKITNIYEWILTDETVTSDLVAAFKKGDSLVFIDKYLRNEITVLLEGSNPQFFIKNKIQDSILNSNEHVVRWDKRGDMMVFITSQGRIVKRDLKNHEYTHIQHNSDEEIRKPTDILIDKNHDIWITTLMNGLFRISLEPFTIIRNNPVFQNPLIIFIGGVENRFAAISISGEGTYVTDESQKVDFNLNPDIYCDSYTFHNDETLFGTNKGIYKLENKKLKLHGAFQHLENERVTLIHSMHGELWYAIASKGLFKKNDKTGEVEHFNKAPAYFYNILVSPDSTALFFGTNNGVYKYSYSDGSIKRLKSSVNGFDLGSYVGNSTIDAYGTMWFSFDNGLFGLTKAGDKVAITEEIYLPSLLIYTLNSDAFGNLLVGTNKGVTNIEVDENGRAISSNTYDKNNGFYGYETHMRSAHKTEDGTIYLGTLEGLIMVKPKFLKKKNTPNKPVINSFKNKNVDNLLNTGKPIVLDSEDNLLLLEFSSVNSKSSFVSYSYRLKGFQENWSKWSKETTAYYNDLPSGKYEFLVRASIDGEGVSDTTVLPFKIVIPFYKNKWFIISVIVLLIIIGIVILELTSSFNKNNIILSRDVGADKKTSLNMLLVGGLVNPAVHLFAPRIDESIAFHDIGALISGALLLILFWMVLTTEFAKKRASNFLVTGFLILLAYNLLYIYLSGIHPFYIIVLLLVFFVTPFVFKRLRSVVVLSLLLGALSVLIIFFVKEPVFNQYLFVMAIGVIGFLAIFMSYIRNNSFEHLIFTSGVVNNGNALVVAFNTKGKISFASENIERILGLSKELKGKDISYLNQFLPHDNKDRRFSNIDLISQFQEGAIFVTPLMTFNNEVVYYQWSCKEFSKEVRVILGQDVTEKINLENYYELIVRNADDLIFQTDTNGNFTFVNDKCEFIFGFSKEELLQTSIYSFIDINYQEKVRKFFSNCLIDRNKGVYIEFPIKSADNSERWLGLNLTAMEKPAAENLIIGFLGLARDVTETLRSNRIIKEQNKDITASINYARRIQFNMLPRSTEFDDIFEENFILYKPKDIVSGDFYWLNNVKDKTILIVSDSTGHGVPGSFMTLLGINILNQIILEEEITDPGEILNRLDKYLMYVLPRDGQNKIQDGMETVVCVFDNNSDQMEYAFAGGRFVITDEQNDKLKVVKGQMKHIGDEAVEDKFTYTTHNMTLTKMQTLYIFTDGYPDQFGGEKNKKLTIKKFLALIDAISPQYLAEQNKILQEHLGEWMGDIPQTDDITVVAVRGLIDK
ncbi:hypothetical protein CW751_11900 [Brumimicrobium salinarum]|uniref:PAS domain-containing protein n=1 Tax=Brumimicrobium salinarum TaxID=2058658 RepID=A0A2I0R0G0_9FLAO|nr:PAS domain S-box protein [Brumimicrobium salinarum]PKR80063.1 hypothetical protein CW751_11900 [Brumimicrobium salinarum]